MASQAITALAKRAESARATLANLKEKGRIQEERVFMVGEVAVGGGLAGLIDGYWNKPEIGGIPAVPAAALLIAVGSLSGFVPGGMHIASLAAGALAGELYDVAQRKAADAAVNK